MRLTTFTASILLSLAIANISNATNPLSAAANTITACNTIGANGTPMCPAPTPTNQEKSETNKAGGNPINLISGNKFESATDIDAVGGEYALRLNRYYNSRSTQRGLFGKGWRSDYEMQLQDTGDKIDVLQADGRKISFTKTADKLEHSSLLITRYKADKAELGYLERTQSTDTSKPAWIWHLPNGKQLQFVAHKQTGITNSDGRYRFGQLSRVTENTNQPNSAYWSLTYDVKGNIAQVQNQEGDTLKFSYQTTKYGLPKISITKSARSHTDSQTWHYLLDKRGNLAQVVSPTGNRTGYAYTDPNDLHNLTAKYSYDKQGNKQLITKWSYDAYDRAISSAHQNGVEKVTISFDPDTLIPMPADHIFTNIITNSVGETTEYNYRFRGDQEQLISVKGAGCATCGPTNVSYEYDNAGRVIKENKLDDEGVVVSTTQREFDKIGRIIKVVQSSAQGEQTWQSYAYGNPDYPMQPTVISRPSVVDGKTAQIKLDYDEHGNVISMTEMGFRPATINNTVKPLNRITKYHYELINGKSLLTAVDGPLPSSKDTTRYHYNGKSQIVSIAYPEGLTQNMSYDDQGRLTALIDIDGTTSTYQYDAKGQITQTNQNGQTTTISYDPMGRIAQVTDPLGQILSYRYNSAGQLISMGDKTQTQIDLIRDKEGNLNAANLLVDGKVEQKQQYDVNDKQSEEDETNNPLSKALLTKQLKDKEGNLTTAYYDDFGRVVAEDSPTTGWTHYDWDNEDNLTKVINPLGQSITIKYDAFGRKTKIITNDDQVTLVWGSFNKLSSVISKNYQVNYTYDDYGNLNQKTWQFNDKTLSAKYKHNESHQVSRIEYPSGLTLNYVYDDKGQLTQITQKSWLKDKLLISNINDLTPYDNESLFNFGNGVSQTQAYRDDDIIEWAGNKEIAYSYSKPYQNGYAIGYNYPHIDRITSTTESSLSHQDIDNSHANSSSIAPSKTVVQHTTNQDRYNTIGQLVQEEGYRYSYDDLGRLTQVSHNDRPIVTYDYLITGERYKKSVIDSNNIKHSTYYLYDNGILVSEFTQIETEANAHYTDYLYLGNRPAIQFNDQRPYYLTTDHRTAVIAATDDDANVVWQASLTDNGQAQILDNAQIQVNLRGSNQYYDSESGLHYNIHRYFSPTRNQYLTPDPVGLAAGKDLYAFANDRPHEFVDWWGLTTEASLLGTFIHNQIFAPQILSKGLMDFPITTWGGQNARDIDELGPTWPTGLGGKIPDAYYVDKTNRYLETSKKEFKGSVWELKPVSVYWNQARYQEAKDQVNSYIKTAKRGKWSAGCAGVLNLKPELFFWNAKLKRVDFFDDKIIPKQFSDVRRLNKPSGLVFYSVKDASKKQQQELTANAAEKLKRASSRGKLKSKIQEIREAATNLTTLEKVGLVVLILAVIISAIAIAAVGVGAVISAAIAALSWVLSSGLSIMTALALTLGSTMTSANAKEQGNKQKKGLLDKFYDKFKSWFD